VQPPTCSHTPAPTDASARHSIDDVLPALYARLRSRVDGVLYRHRIPPEDSEDLVQTALLFAVTKWESIRDPEAWLLGTVHKSCLLYWRTRRSYAEGTRQLVESDLERGVEPDHGRRDCLVDLAKVWHHLTPAQRTLLILRYQEGMSPGEAAQAMGLASSSVRKIAQRAFDRLREALDTAPTRGARRKGPRVPGGRPARDLTSGQAGRRVSVSPLRE